MFSIGLPLLLAIGGISAQCLTGNNSPMVMNSATKKSLIDARFSFALENLEKSVQIQPQGNIALSPYSLYQAISLLYFVSRGITEEKLKHVLCIPDDLSKADVQRYYALENFFNTKETSDSYEYRIANRLWVADDRKLRECMVNFFGEQLKKIDFRTDPEATRMRINNWVGNMTEGKIRDLLAPSAIDNSTDLVLVNAAYFKGLWTNRVGSNNSKWDTFYASGSQKFTVKFMCQKGYLKHVASKDLGADILELPYKDGKISMFVLKPSFSTRNVRSYQIPGDQPQDSIGQLTKQLTTKKGSQKLRNVFDDRTSYQDVKIWLPFRFLAYRDQDDNELLNVMGAGELMSPTADLRGLVADGEPNLHLSDAVHSATFEVTEKGTTSAAATAFSSRSARSTKSLVFHADHPFVYVIYDKLGKKIFSTGVNDIPSQLQEIL